MNRFVVITNDKFVKLGGRQPQFCNMLFHKCDNSIKMIEQPQFVNCRTAVFSRCRTEFSNWWLYPSIFPSVENIVIDCMTPYNIHMRFSTQIKPTPIFHIVDQFRYRFDTFQSSTRKIPELNFITVEDYKKMYSLEKTTESIENDV